MTRTATDQNASIHHRDPSIAIIGGGVGGIATAVKLKQAGFTDFTIFERSDGPGGTWRDNTYPGCEVDIHSHNYSYSFMPYDWSRTHAGQPELLQYLEDTIDHFAIRSHFRFGANVDEVAWDGERRCYRLRLAGGPELEFTMVVSCVGLLSNPKYPDWPGLEDFAGIKFHTARWEHEHDLSGKRVAVVGTGSTGAQLVPTLAPITEHLYVFQREPGWVVPKPARDFTPLERARYRRSGIYRAWVRYKQFFATERLVKAARRVGTKGNARFHKMALEHIEREITDPELRKAVTPDFPFGCKRIIQASTFYPALNREDVTLVPHPVTRVTPTGVVGDDGIEREVDVLIIGVGFKAQSFLGSLRVVGKDGRTLQEVWGESAKALLGLTVPGFPNFFILYGPNTNGGGSAIYTDERGAEAVARAAKRLRRDPRPLDTRPAALDWYVKWVDRMNRKYLSATYHCHNYFFAPDGRNVTQWPLTGLIFSLMLRIVIPLATVRLPAPRRDPGVVASPRATAASSEPEPAPAWPAS